MDSTLKTNKLLYKMVKPKNLTKAPKKIVGTFNQDLSIETHAVDTWDRMAGYTWQPGEYEAFENELFKGVDMSLVDGI